MLVNVCTLSLNSEGFKEIDFLPQTQIFLAQYLCNLMVQTFDFS